MPNLIECPSCRRQLQVPDELMGRKVQCPTCGLAFITTAASSAPSVSPADAEVRPEDYRPEQYGRPWEPLEGVDRARRLVVAPAVCLLLTGLLGILINLAQIFLAAFFPEFFKPRADLPEFLKGLQTPTPSAQIAAGVIFGLASLLVLMAGVQMLRLRTWTLALAGSIIAMINCGNACCCMGLPFGIWCLIVLLKPEVKAVFDRVAD